MSLHILLIYLVAGHLEYSNLFSSDSFYEKKKKFQNAHINFISGERKTSNTVPVVTPPQLKIIIKLYILVTTK
jgi:hypothetical protein